MDTQDVSIENFKDENSSKDVFLFNRSLLSIKHLKIYAVIPLCLFSILQGMVVTGQLTISLPSLEKQFGFTSFESGVIHTVYDITFAIGSIFFSRFGYKRKPLTIAIGGILMSAGCFLFFMPQLIDKGDFSFGKNIWLSRINGQYIDYCTKDFTESSPIVCSQNTNILPLLIFCLGYGLIGIGASPLHTLAIIYLNLNFSHSRSNIYISIFYICATIGPAIGFGLGKPFLSIPVNLVSITNKTLYNSENIDWVGAWWIGYIIAGVLFIAASISILLLPNRFPRSLIENHGNNSVIYQIKNILKNINFILLSTFMLFQGIFTNGFGNFLPKYIQVQFRFSPSTASLVTGVLGVLGAGIGMLIGGIAVKKMGDNNKKKIIFSTIFYGLSILFLILGLSFGCPTRKLEFLNLDNNKFVIKKDQDSNIDCKCSQTEYNPVCLEGNKNYFSPCVAKCTVKEVSDIIKYSECHNLPNQTLIRNPCPEKCYMKYLALVALFFSLVVEFICFIPVLSLIINFLPIPLKDTGLAVNQVFTRVGFVLGPIIFGKLIDNACLFWLRKRCLKYSAYCLEYNNFKFRLNLLILSIGIKVPALLLLIVISYILFKNR